MRPSFRVAVAALAAAALSGLLVAPGRGGEPAAAPAGARRAVEGEAAPAPPPDADAAPDGKAVPPAAGNGPGGEKPGPPEPAPETRAEQANGSRKPRSWFVFTPRTVGYRTFRERLRVGSGTERGSVIRPERDLSMGYTQVISPDINVEINTEVVGLVARFTISLTDDSLYGFCQLDRPLTFGRTTFPAGAAAGFELHRQRIQLRYVQELVRSSLFEMDAAVGAEYFYFMNKIKAPGFATRRDQTEFVIPTAGLMARYAPVWWGRLFLRVHGMYWNLGREFGEAGTLDAAAGVSVRFTKTWGFILGFSASYSSIAKGYPSRVGIGLLDFGPELAITASL